MHLGRSTTLAVAQEAADDIVIRMAGADVFWLRRRQNRVSVSGRLLDGHGATTTLEDNRITQNDAGLKEERSDPHTLVVRGRDDQPVLRVVYASPRDVTLTGTFAPPEGAALVITDDVINYADWVPFPGACVVGTLKIARDVTIGTPTT